MFGLSSLSFSALEFQANSWSGGLGLAYCWTLFTPPLIAITEGAMNKGGATFFQHTPLVCLQHPEKKYCKAEKKEENTPGGCRGSRLPFAVRPRVRPTPNRQALRSAQISADSVDLVEFSCRARALGGEEVSAPRKTGGVTHIYIHMCIYIYMYIHMYIYIYIYRDVCIIYIYM